MRTFTALVILLLSGPLEAQTIQGRWKLVEAVDLHPDGSVATYPSGAATRSEPLSRKAAPATCKSC